MTKSVAVVNPVEVVEAEKSFTPVIPIGFPDATLTPIDSIKVNIFVRNEQPPTDRIQFFRELYADGMPVPPIVLKQGTSEVIDGRSRLQAARELGATHIPARFEEVKNPLDHLIKATRANEASSLPSSRADRLYVIEQMINLGYGEKEAKKQLGDVWSANQIRQLFRDVHSERDKKAKASARRAIAEDNLTVEAAAAKFKVNVELLRQDIAGVTKSPKRNYGAAEISGTIGTMSKKFNSSLGTVLTKVDQRVANGEMDLEEAKKVYDQVNRLLTTAVKRQSENKARLVSKMATTASA